MTRIVAGSVRGRQLTVPPGSDVRPTTDRAREAIFNSLHSAGLVEGARVLDLFAGSGALGLEALSRGAAHATFVERAPRAVATVRRNLEALDLAASATVVQSDAFAFLRRQPGHFDIALLDPPYAFDRWDELVDALDAGALVIESDRPVHPGPGWVSFKEGRYGATVVVISLPGAASRGAP